MIEWTSPLLGSVRSLSGFGGLAYRPDWTYQACAGDVSRDGAVQSFLWSDGNELVARLVDGEEDCEELATHLRGWVRWRGYHLPVGRPEQIELLRRAVFTAMNGVQNERYDAAYEVWMTSEPWNIPGISRSWNALVEALETDWRHIDGERRSLILDYMMDVVETLQLMMPLMSNRVFNRTAMVLMLLDKLGRPVFRNLLNSLWSRGALKMDCTRRYVVRVDPRGNPNWSVASEVPKSWGVEGFGMSPMVHGELRGDDWHVRFSADTAVIGGLAVMVWPAIVGGVKTLIENRS